MISNHLRALSEYLDLHSSNYEKFIILGDFNVEMEAQQIESFSRNYSLRNLIRQPACTKAQQSRLASF